MHPYIPVFIHDKLRQNEISGEFNAFVMFCDISGFTPLTETLLKYGKPGSEILIRILSKIFNPMVDTIYSNRGFIATFGGDAFYAIFIHDDISISRKEAFAFSMNSANEILHFFEREGIIETDMGSYKLSVKMGIAEGLVKWGILGNENGRGYYFRGNAIDEAAEMEHKTSKGNYTLSEKLKRDFTDTFQPDEIASISSTDIPDDVLKEFFPDEFVIWEKGEFRQIVSIFIPLEGDFNHDLIDRIFRLTFAEVALFDGFLSRLSFGDKGAMMLIFFGFPTSHEDDIKRALSFADEWRKKLVDEHIAVFYRMGITYGLAYAGVSGGERRSELTCLGDVVNFAARLAFAGEKNEIYCSDMIAEKASSFAQVPLSFARKFKGKSDILPVYRFIKLKKVDQQRFFKSPMIGREKELKQVKEIIQDTIINKQFGGIIYINGESGIGKSRLVHEIKNWAENELKINWLHIPCDGVVERPWNGIKQWLKSFFEIGDEIKKEDVGKFMSKINEICEDREIDDMIRREISRTSSLIAAEIGIHMENSLYEKLDSRLRLENFIIGLKELIKALSIKNPTIIEIEDGQWIDSSTEEFLLPLTRNVNDFPFLVLITSRYMEDGEPVNFRISRGCSIEEIDLKPLSEGCENAFAVNILGKGQLSQEILDLLKKTAYGNPFYIEQLLRHLQDTGAVELRNGKWEITSNKIELPSSIDQVIIARIDSLGIQTKEILQHASIIGQRFAIKLLSEMLKDYPVYEYLSSAHKKAQLVYPEDMNEEFHNLIYLFSHALIRNVVYDMQLAETKQKLHKNVMHLIEEMFKDNLVEWYEDLYNHARMSEDEEKLKYYLEKSGDLHRYNYRHKEAIERYQELLNLDITLETKIDILLKLSSIYSSIGPYSKGVEYCRTALEYFGDSDNKKLLANIYHYYARILSLSGNNDMALDYIKQACEIFLEYNEEGSYADSLSFLGGILINKSEFSSARNKFMKAFDIYEKKNFQKGKVNCTDSIISTYVLTGRIDDALKYWEKRKDIIETGYDLSTEVRIKNNLGRIFADSDLEKAEEYFRDAMRISEEMGDRTLESMTINNLAIISQKRGDFRTAIEIFNKSAEISKEVGNIRLMGRAFYNIGTCHEQLFEYDKAIDCHNKYIEMSRIFSSKSAEGASVYALGNIYRNMGKYDTARDCFKNLHELSVEIKEPIDILLSLIVLVDILFLLNDFDGVEKYYQIALSQDFEKTELGNDFKILDLKYNIYKGNLVNAGKLVKLLTDTSCCFNEDMKGDVYLFSGKYYELISDFITSYDFYRKAIDELKESNLLVDYADTLIELSRMLMNFRHEFSCGDKLKECKDLEEFYKSHDKSEIMKLLNEARDFNEKCMRYHRISEINDLIRQIE
ncbi:MAG: tetratricopeptide repeat protein [Candidatus Coatesbacteria bacterium]|nr:tetratricopeptide repeat protein [Candidatus Coatesbacteria bacterium]